VTKPFKVLISDEMSSRAAEVLSASDAVEVDVRAGLDPGDLLSVIGDYNGLLVRSRTKVTAEVLAAAANLKLIGRAGIGVDNIDLAEASRRGVLVENAPSGNSVTTAEHAISLLLSLARHIPQATASLKAGKWEKKKLKGREMMDKTLGVVGLGNIGRIVASRARGLKMKLIGYDPFLGREAAERIGVELLDLDELFTRADAITVHTPLTDQTRAMIGAEAFAKMKDGVMIVNAARGGIVDERALLDALDSGKVWGAALDVFTEEPPLADHPLLAHPRLICTPHLGASTREAQEKVAVEVASQVVAFAERGEIRNAINMATVPPDVRERLAPWTELSRCLGAMVGQLVRSDAGGAFVDELAVELIGEPGELGSTAVKNAVLIGLMGIYTEGPVNEVNAPVVAADRGLDVSETRHGRDPALSAAVAVSARCGETTRYVKGTLYHVGERVEPRLVQIDEFIIEATPRGTVLVVLNKDRPGVIGAVGTLLGEREINVAGLNVGSTSDRDVAVALWNVADAELGGELVDAVRSLELVDSAQVIRL
jgi:D-3-phosphoglycerate dehydrogenase